MHLVILNRLKLGHAVTLMKYLASVVFFIILPKTLIGNKIAFPVSVFAEPSELGVSKMYQHPFSIRFRINFVVITFYIELPC